MARGPGYSGEPVPSPGRRPSGQRRLGAAALTQQRAAISAVLPCDDDDTGLSVSLTHVCPCSQIVPTPKGTHEGAVWWARLLGGPEKAWAV